MLTKKEVMSQARITRPQIRYWKTLWPVLNKKRKFLPAEAVALAALSQVVRDTRCDIVHLKPVAAAVFAALTEGDWQHFEHRRMLIVLPAGNVEFPLGAGPLVLPAGTIVAVDLGPHVRAVRSRALGLPPVERQPQTPLLDERSRKRKLAGEAAQPRP